MRAFSIGHFIDPLHTVSYKAFCRNNGTYCTEAKGARCWNEEVLNTMNEIMAAEWQLLESDCDDVVSASADTIQKQVQKLTKDIQSKAAGHMAFSGLLILSLELEGSALFVKIMRTKEAKVKYILVEEAEHMLKQLRQAHTANLCRTIHVRANN